HFVRLPSQEEWTRFESYTSRIRGIRVSTGDFVHMVNVLATLSMKYHANPAQHLFPNLQTLIWQSEQKTELPFAHLFLPPSLRCLELRLYCGPDDARGPGFLLLLENQCPTLSQFHMCGIDVHMHVAAVSRSLESPACHQLESLTCGEIDEPALRYIAKLATLKDLSIDLPDWLSTYVPRADEGFVNLQTLSLAAPEISAVVGFLPSTQLSLKSLKIEITSAKPHARALLSAPLQRLFLRLSAGLSYTRLTRFHLLQSDTGASRGDKETLDFAALRPLFLFPELRSVYIDGFCSSGLNDNNLAELAGAWPHLEEFTLNPSPGWRHTPEITFQGLGSLVRACPSLRDLALTIDATQLTSAAPGEDNDIHNDNIKTLNLGQSIIAKPADVAVVFGELFWSLKQVVVSRYQHQNGVQVQSSYLKLWDEVNSHLRRAQAGKAQTGK
ncbi:hypothetical protein BJ138DRAFT_1139861, partial [Hygrophoropsis aurantiaca]